MDRKTLRTILENEELDNNAKIGSMLTAFHDEVADIKVGLKTDDDVKKAVAEALKNAPSKVKAEELDEYKTLKQEFDDYKYKTDVTGQLKGLNVKDKFISDVIAKIKRGEKEEALDKQITALKEQYGEFFEADGCATPTPAPQQKPVFGATPTPTNPPVVKPIPKIF